MIAEQIVLPDMVVVQMDAYGNASNVMPKMLAVIIPFGISTIFAVLYRNSRGSLKYLIISILGLVLPIVIIIFNIVCK